MTCRRTFVVALLGVLLLISTACGSDDAADTTTVPTTSPTTAATTTTTTALPTVEQLAGLLLTIDELPPISLESPDGQTLPIPWTEGSSTVGTYPLTEILEITIPPYWAAPFPELPVPRDLASVEYGHVIGDLGDYGPDLVQILTTTTDPSQLSVDLKTMLGVPGPSGWDEATQVAAPDVGDSSLAYRWTAEDDETTGNTYTADFIVVFRGQVVELYVTYGFFGGITPAAQLTEEQLLTVVTTGDAKVVAGLGSGT